MLQASMGRARAAEQPAEQGGGLTRADCGSTANGGAECSAAQPSTPLPGGLLQQVASVCQILQTVASANDGSQQQQHQHQQLDALHIQLANLHSKLQELLQAGSLPAAGHPPPAAAAVPTPTSGSSSADAHAAAAARLFSGAAAATAPGARGAREVGWWYRGDDSSLRGPYPSTTMLRWWCQGFLEDGLAVAAVAEQPDGSVPRPAGALRPLLDLIAAVAAGGRFEPEDPAWLPDAAGGAGGGWGVQQAAKVAPSREASPEKWQSAYPPQPAARRLDQTSPRRAVRAAAGRVPVPPQRAQPQHLSPRLSLQSEIQQHLHQTLQQQQQQQHPATGPHDLLLPLPPSPPEQPPPAATGTARPCPRPPHMRAMTPPAGMGPKSPCGSSAAASGRTTPVTPPAGSLPVSTSAAVVHDGGELASGQTLHARARGCIVPAAQEATLAGFGSSCSLADATTSTAAATAAAPAIAAAPAAQRPSPSGSPAKLLNSLREAPRLESSPARAMLTWRGLVRSQRPQPIEMELKDLVRSHARHQEQQQLLQAQLPPPLAPQPPAAVGAAVAAAAPDGRGGGRKVLAAAAILSGSLHNALRSLSP